MASAATRASHIGYPPNTANAVAWSPSENIHTPKNTAKTACESARENGVEIWLLRENDVTL